MAKEATPAAHVFGRYQTPGRKTVRFMNDDMAAQNVGVYENLGYTIDRTEHNHVIMSTTDDQAEKNRLAAIALHNRQVRPSVPLAPMGAGVKAIEVEDERRSTPDMTPPSIDGL